MKTILLLVFLGTFAMSASDCKDKNKVAKTYKAKFEIKAICSNYTMRLIEGDLDTSLVVANWTDETTGKSYKNAFALQNPCGFPETIKQGDEFYFTIDTAEQKNCIVCMAYYPKPPKALAIKVVDK